MLGRLYNERESCRTPAVLSACRSGAEFLRKHAPAPGGRAYFCLSREGQVSVWIVECLNR